MQILPENVGDSPVRSTRCPRYRAGRKVALEPATHFYILSMKWVRKMRPEPSLTLTKRILATLTERIVDGSLPPGAPVRQDRVAEEFGSSHVPVREAFRLLEAEGLLIALPRKGVRVA